RGSGDHDAVAARSKREGLGERWRSDRAATEEDRVIARAGDGESAVRQHTQGVRPRAPRQWREFIPTIEGELAHRVRRPIRHVGDPARHVDAVGNAAHLDALDCAAADIDEGDRPVLLDGYGEAAVVEPGELV